MFTGFYLWANQTSAAWRHTRGSLVAMALSLGVFATPHNLAAQPAPPKHSPEEVVVVMNLKSPVSRAIATHYEKARHVTNVVHVSCQDSSVNAEDETMPYKDYQNEIEKPIRAFLALHPRVNFIVLTKGVPFRLEGGPMGNAWDGVKVGVATASIDSTLAALGYDKLADAKKYHFTGTMPGPSAANGYAWANRYWNAQEPFSHAKFGGYLVSRLDAYTQAGAIKLVDDALESEQHPPQGTVLLDAQSDFGVDDDYHSQPAPYRSLTIPEELPWSAWFADMGHAAEVLQTRGVAVELDMTPNFVGHREGLAGYYSAGSNDPHYTDKLYQSLHFAPGSIGDTAVSTSARSLLPTHDGGQSLIADLVQHGLTAAKGYCYEPWLQANSSPTITLARYYAGYTMAESFYMGSHLVGWEDVVLGDPLCAPFAK